MKPTLLIASLLVLAAACTTPSPSGDDAPVVEEETSEDVSPPQAERIPYWTKIHGETIRDPYHWMRKRDDPRVHAYLQAENAYAEKVMHHTEEFRRTLFDEMRGHIEESDLSAPNRVDDYFYYSRTVEGENYEVHCRKKGSLDAPEEVILDENALAEGHDFFELGVFEVSDDHNFLAYSVDTRGDERFTMKIKDLRSGDVLSEPIPQTYYTAAWGADGRTLFYTRVDESHRPNRLFRHVVGTNPAGDEIVVEEKDADFFVSVRKTRSERFILAEIESALSREIHVLDADDPGGEFQLLAPRRENVEYYVEHHGDRFFVLTNEDAVNFKLMETPVSTPARSHWKEVLGPRDDVFLQRVDAFAHHLVIHERADGLPRIVVRDLTTDESHEISFPEPTYTTWIGENPTFDTTKVRIEYTSLVTPRTVYDYDMKERSWEVVKETDVPGYEPTNYVSRRVEAVADDGTRIPISMVHHRDVSPDESSPLLLTGYGAYGFSYDPSFSAPRLALLDRGVIFAIAHVRGGGEKGRSWYRAGKLTRKMTTFTDFIASAEHLIEEGYTSPDRLAIAGRSAGGLLIGAVTNMRPELFGAVVTDVPFVDVLNTMLDETLPVSANDLDEWGDPREEQHFDYIRRYAPYDNIREQDYPPMLITTGFEDPRVGYWEPAKWAARLRHRRIDDDLLILRTHMDPGHTRRDGRYDYLHEVAFEYAFILDQLDVVRFDEESRR